VVLVPALVLVGVKYWQQMASRWTEGSSVSAASMTSGRTEIWQGYLMKMLAYPWTFITGFGWDAYSVMNFPVVPHNEYLTLWFTIGLLGIVGIIAIFRGVVQAALAAAQATGGPSNARRHMVAAVFGTLILGVAIFFGTLFIPWAFIWMYFGLIMRYSLAVRAAHSPITVNRDRPQLAARGRLPLSVRETSRST
jgi:O-antigen ligase